MTSREEKLQSILESERRINEIKDTDVLLQQILTEARRITNADAGSIYVVENKAAPRNFLKLNSESVLPLSSMTHTLYSESPDRRREFFKNKQLRIKYAQNATKKQDGYKNFAFNIAETSISGYSIFSNELINIEDAYDIGKDKPYSFDDTTDRQMQYRTKSMLTIPLVSSTDKPLGVLQIINAQDSSKNPIPFDDDAVLCVKHFAYSAAQALEHSYLTNSMIIRMQQMAEFRDPKETFHHVQRVSEFSDIIYVRWAKEHDVPAEELKRFRDCLRIASKCHDFGKVGVSDVILKKAGPGRFTDEERGVMKGHTLIGAKLFAEVESDFDEMARDVALRHHEWWDGSENGYPGNVNYLSYEIGRPVEKGIPLKGDEIPLSARIVAIADVFDALSHRRCYKEAWSVDDAFLEIQNSSGTQFDPELVMCFLAERERILMVNLRYESNED
ncbi:MAG: HD domain-containing protein [Treponema sp.]|nr:HD domain-containing protein [Treponema sp.]MCR5125194.1 HD domain-containing protein [Treponema sp.]